MKILNKCLDGVECLSELSSQDEHQKHDQVYHLILEIYQVSERKQSAGHVHLYVMVLSQLP